MPGAIRIANPGGLRWGATIQACGDGSDRAGRFGASSGTRRWWALGAFFLVVLIKNSADRALWLALPLIGLGFALIWFVIRLGVYVSDYGLRVNSIRAWKTVPWHQVAAMR